MKHSLRLTRIAHAAVSLAACCLLNCNSKLPTPIISGPDSGWTRAPVLLAAHRADGSPTGHTESWQWDDGTGGTTYPIHTYGAPGIYKVTCFVYSFSGFFGPTRQSDPSAPHAIRILPDTLRYPDSIVATIPLGPRGRGWACVLPDGSRLYVTNAAADSVSVISTSTNSVSAAVAMPDSPTCCIASNSGQFVYVSSTAARVVSVIRTSDDSVVSTIQMSGEPGRLALLPNDSFLYVAEVASNYISVIRTDDDSLIARVNLGCVPTGLAVQPGGTTVFVVSDSAGRVLVIRTSDNSVVSSTNLAGDPSDVQFSPGGETAYIPCPLTSSIAMLRTTDLGVAGTVCFDSLGFAKPRSITMLPGGQCLYVASAMSYATTGAIVRRSDNYLLRRLRLGDVDKPVPHPDGMCVYYPLATGVQVLGLRPSR